MRGGLRRALSGVLPGQLADTGGTVGHMSDVSTIWIGPVSKAQAQQADASFVTCTGDGNPTCGQMADARGGSLRSLAAELGILVDPAPRLVLRAFSAGGSAVKRYLDNDDSRSLVLAVTLADGTYETSSGYVSPGFLKYGVESAGGGKLFVATASSAPNKTYGSGEQVLANLQAAIERQTGQTFQRVTVEGLGDGWRLGGCWFFPVGSAYQHAEHATRLAPIVWTQIVLPFLSGDLGVNGGGTGDILSAIPGTSSGQSMDSSGMAQGSELTAAGPPRWAFTALAVFTLLALGFAVAAADESVS